MARLLDWPIGLGRTALQRLTGPRAVGATSTESIEGFVQTVASAFGVWRYQISIQTTQGRKARLYRAMVTALHGGANAVRVPFTDPDVMSFAESGVNATAEQLLDGITWSNGASWSNGQGWGVGRPRPGIGVNAAQGATIIVLVNEYWGGALLGGEWIGFMPFHFGKYEITEVIAPRQYRIWPPLRKALVAGSDYATLNPIVAMRLESESAGTVTRGLVAAEGNVMTMVEVEDADVRAYFAD